MNLRFIGQDGSMGLRSGHVYQLAVRPQGAGVLITEPIYCPYSSQEAFWRNWCRPEEKVQ